MSRSTLVVLFVAGLLALSAALSLLGHRLPGDPVPPSPANPIVVENQRPGTPLYDAAGWQRLRDQLTTSVVDEPHPGPSAGADGGNARAGDGAPPVAGAYDPGVISGYTSRTSINHGEAIDFLVSTTLPSFSLEVYRMGYYGGVGSRLIARVTGIPGQAQPVPPPDPTTGLVQAGWTSSYTLQTDVSWVSGVYLGHLIASDGSTQDTVFVVRADGTPADILYELPVTTWQAYNNWGGKSLYDENPTGPRAVKVSFDRPYDADHSNGAGLYFDGDDNLIRWLEKQGYLVTYATSIDLATTPGIVAGRKIVLSNVHDEYWSKAMRDNLAAARDRGIQLAFLSANDVYWQVRFESSSDGRPNRVMVCYKDASRDPLSQTSPTLTTVQWQDPPVNLPESPLVGLAYGAYLPGGGAFPWVVQNASHWLYAGTGLHEGDPIPGMVGGEYDQLGDSDLTPPTLMLLASSPVTGGDGPTLANAAIYTATSGALVFDAGTFYWARKLENNDVFQDADARVQQMTTNLLTRMLALAPAPTVYLPVGVVTYQGGW